MKVRIWDEYTGALVGVIEQEGFMDIIWFAPTFSTLMTEKEPGHYDLSIKVRTQGKFLMTHAYLGIPSLPYGRETQQATGEA